MEGDDNLWAAALLGADFVPYCVAHIIVPTIFTTRLARWEDLSTRHERASDPRWLRIQAKNMECCFCATNLSGDIATVGVRALIAKRPCVRVPGTTLARLDDSGPDSMFRCGFGSVSICQPCTRKRNLRIQLDSDTSMQEEMFERLEAMAARQGLDPASGALSGDEFLRRLLNVFDEDRHRSGFMRAIGKHSDAHHCTYCKRTDVKTSRCSRCHFMRYCGPKCSAADWPTHRQLECPTLAQCSVFYGGRCNETVVVV
jgi:hypothetical protein